MIGSLNVLTMVLAGGKGERLSPLTTHRSKPAVPFGGSFRIIDFTLMNCVLSGIRRIHILTQYYSHSLNTHLQDHWSFLSRELGDTIQALPPKLRSEGAVYRGTADAIYRNLDMIEAVRPDIVLILSGDHVYRADYSRMVRHHIESESDVTVLCGEVDQAEASAFGIVNSNEDGRIREFIEKPKDPSPYARGGRCKINLGVYCFDTRFLVQRLVADAKRRTAHDFGKNILPESVRIGRVVDCPFADIAPGRPYWRDVGSIDSYFQCHQDLLETPADFELCDPRWCADSRFRELLPARLASCSSVGGDSLVCAGATIGRSRVERSVISPQVQIADGAAVERSILFRGVRVGPNARIRNAIIDEGVEVPAGAEIGFGQDSCDFLVSEGGVVVIEKGHRFEGTLRGERSRGTADASAVALGGRLVGAAAEGLVNN